MERRQISIEDIFIEENKALREAKLDKHPLSNTGAIPILNDNLVSLDTKNENDNLENSNIFIDWLSATIPVEEYYSEDTGEIVLTTNPNTFKLIDSLKKFMNVPDNFVYKMEIGSKGYKQGFSYGEHIKVYYSCLQTSRTVDGKETIYLDISGAGCRELERFCGSNFTWQNFIENLLIYYHASFTRLDFSCDIFTEKFFTLEKLFSKLRLFHYVSPVSFLHHQFKTEDGKKVSNSCYVGSLSSDRYLLIYDKLEERKSNATVYHLFINTWIRFEMRFKQKWAKRLAIDLSQCESVPVLFKGCLYDFLDIKTKSRKSVVNPSQLPTWPNWLEFLDHVSKIKLTNQEQKESNLFTKKKWFDRCVSRFLLQSYIADDDFEDKIYETILKKMEDFNDKDLVEINSYLASKGEEPWNMDEAIQRLNHLKETYEIKKAL